MEQKKSRSVQVPKKPAEPVKSPESSSPVKPVEKKKWIVPNCIYRITRRISRTLHKFPIPMNNRAAMAGSSSTRPPLVHLSDDDDDDIIEISPSQEHSSGSSSLRQELHTARNLVAKKDAIIAIKDAEIQRSMATNPNNLDSQNGRQLSNLQSSSSMAQQLKEALQALEQKDDLLQTQEEKLQAAILKTSQTELLADENESLKKKLQKCEEAKFYSEDRAAKWKASYHADTGTLQKLNTTLCKSSEPYQLTTCLPIRNGGSHELKNVQKFVTWLLNHISGQGPQSEVIVVVTNFNTDMIRFFPSGWQNPDVQTPPPPSEHTPIPIFTFPIFRHSHSQGADCVFHSFYYEWLDKTKIDEIREIIKEHKEISLPDAYKKEWIQTGYRNIGTAEDCDVNPNEDWCNIICKVVDKHQASITKNFNPTREAIEAIDLPGNGVTRVLTLSNRWIAKIASRICTKHLLKSEKSTLKEKFPLA
ncbi:unnamed protein product [Caenorhabditis brenneri]